MTNELENRIKDLEDQISVLEKQKNIVVNFISLAPDYVSSAIRSMAAGNLKKAEESLLALQTNALESGKQVIALQKRP